MNEARPISLEGAASEASRLEGDVRIEYASQGIFEAAARQFGVFEEWKVPCFVRLNFYLR